ncbi:hypothetical protein MLD38_032424 [Melastoma candidum]|uniref:Uncharacterized protein n=1 Tax=Melastoma candidum TaxID=119954 RepID=A0ACB9M5U3_9MYRT|nr:hypothetical protein MLD38_032424 [Melastoma candidum]
MYQIPRFVPELTNKIMALKLASVSMVRFLFLFVIYYILLMIPSTCGTSDSDLSWICSLTQNDEHCKQLLLSDPRTNSSDPPLISLISIELAHKQATYNLGEFTGYRDNSTDPSLGKLFGNCTEMYQAIVYDLDKVYGLSKQGDYKGVLNEGTPTKEVYDCENDLPPSLPTMAITEDMLLALETLSGVASYVVYKTSRHP